jgi:hypothetical protein
MNTIVRIKTASRVGMFILLLLLTIPHAALKAQIGSNWREYFPKAKLQQENSVRYSSYEKTNGVEHFKMWKNPSGSRQRCEMQVEDGYTRGATQFEGEFFIVKGGGPAAGDDVCIMQVWLSMIVSISDTNGGSMYQHGSVALADHLAGRWVRINVIHDADNDTAEIWIDGEKKWSGHTKKSDAFYHKYGLYNQAVNNPEICWRKIRYFRKMGDKASGYNREHG